MHIDIINLRLHNQHLLRNKFEKASDVVSWLGAVQAQDFAAAKWAVGLRMAKATDQDIEKAYNNGEILRTHVMRPTWHFVMPEDIRWMLELTAPRVKAFMAHYNRKLELDDELFKKSNAAIVRALQNHKYLTRQELKKILADIGIKTDVQRLAHIIMWAELDGLICSGPRQSKQFTYALLEDRAPKVKKLDQSESLAKLALKYFTSHGPAQLRDFTWWSGLSVKDATKALDSIKSKLSKESVDNKIYWFSPTSHPQSPTQTAFLLSIYDEYTIAYNDRSDLSERNDIERMIQMGNALTAVLIINGKVAGTWKRILKSKGVEIKINPFRPLSKSKNAVLKKEIERYGKFLEMPILSII